MVYIDAFGLMEESTSGGGFWNSVCDSICGWFGGGSSSDTGGTTNSSNFSIESGQTASSPQGVKEYVLNDGTRIIENKYYPDCVVIYPDGNNQFLQQYQGRTLGRTVEGYCNGANTSLYEACRNAQVMIESSKGQVQHILIAYNATDGICKDLLHAAAGSVGLPVASTATLAENITAFFHDCAREGIFFHTRFFGHSEGSVILSNMDSQLRKDDVTKNFIQFNENCYLGGPILREGVTNYVSVGDPVSAWAIYCCALQEDPYFDNILHNTHLVGSMIDPLSAHSFAGANYREALKQELGG